MYYNLISIFLFFNIIFSEEIIRKDYYWPTDASNTITTVFGDQRSRRFHAGIDVRTYGEIGKNIYAIESGYISRISINPNGYGKAIYLTLDDGNTVLYAHLNEFIKKVDNNADAYNWLGFSYRQLEKYAEAFEPYRQALAINKKHLGANEYLGELFLKTNNPKKAKKTIGPFKMKSCEFFNLGIYKS